MSAVNAAKVSTIVPIDNQTIIMPDKSRRAAFMADKELATVSTIHQFAISRCLQYLFEDVRTVLNAYERGRRLNPKGRALGRRM